MSIVLIGISCSKMVGVRESVRARARANERKRVREREIEREREREKTPCLTLSQFALSIVSSVS